MEKHIYTALKNIMFSTLLEASLHMDTVDFLKLTAEIKDMIQYYEEHIQTYTPAS